MNLWSGLLLNGLIKCVVLTLWTAALMTPCITHTSNHNETAFTLSHKPRAILRSRQKRQLDDFIPLLQTGFGESPESRTIAEAVCKVHCLKICSDNLKQKATAHTPTDEIMKDLTTLPTQLHKECSRLSPRFLYYDECEQACESGRLYHECARMCETGDSPGGWSCLNGCRMLDAAFKERSGECPPYNELAIHRLPSRTHLNNGWSGQGDSATEMLKERVNKRTENTDKMHHRQFMNYRKKANNTDLRVCTVDAECPNSQHKCCSSECRKSVFKEGLFPKIPPIRILEAKNPPSFSLSWEQGLSALNNISDPTVYVLQVKTFFGPEFDSHLASPWKTLVMSTLTRAQLSEPDVGWWYQFQVAAVNRFGSLGFDIPSPPVQLTSQKPEPPSTPRDFREGVLTLHASGEIRVYVQWSAPAVVSIPVTEYRISWGPDSNEVSPDSEFSEKPTQYVQTVPASQTSYQLVGLVADTLYKVQILAMSEWGSYQLRSRPNTIYISTPHLNNLQQTYSQDLRNHADQLQSDIEQFEFDSQTPSSEIRTNEIPEAKVDLAQTALNSRRVSEICVCDGTSKSVVLPDVRLERRKQRLTLYAEPVVFDGQDISVRVHVAELASPNEMNTEISGSRTLLMRWTPQVCIENFVLANSRLSVDPSGARPANTNERGAQDSNVGSQEQVIHLHSYSRDSLNPPYLSNHTVLRQGVAEIRQIGLHCRYFFQLFKISSQPRVLEEHAPELSACLCTPACSHLVLVPWVPKIDCERTVITSAPTPKDLRYKLIGNTPITYNITWAPGNHPKPANGSSFPLPIGSRADFDSDNDVSTDMDLMSYRIVWGPSQDQPFTTRLRDDFHPRLDSSRAETKILPNGERSYILTSLEPGTQYVVKVQAIPVSLTKMPESQSAGSFRVGHDQMSPRSVGPRVMAVTTLTSKEILTHFRTPQRKQINRGTVAVNKIESSNKACRKIIFLLPFLRLYL